VKDKKRSPQEINFNFKKLFSKEIPLKKFKFVTDQYCFSKTGFWDFLKGISSYQLEKLQINVGHHYKPSNAAEIDTILDFIRGLVNIRVLKLDSLDVPLQVFSTLIEAVLTLKGITKVYIGKVSEQVPQESFVRCIEQILSKYGLRAFNCRTPKDFVRACESKCKNRGFIKMRDIKRRNPYLESIESAHPLSWIIAV